MIETLDWLDMQGMDIMIMFTGKSFCWYELDWGNGTNLELDVSQSWFYFPCHIHIKSPCHSGFAWYGPWWMPMSHLRSSLSFMSTVFASIAHNLFSVCCCLVRNAITFVHLHRLFVRRGHLGMRVCLFLSSATKQTQGLRGSRGVHEVLVQVSEVFNYTYASQVFTLCSGLNSHLLGFFRGRHVYSLRLTCSVSERLEFALFLLEICSPYTLSMFIGRGELVFW